MVSKEEAKNRLRKAGYNLAADNAVITVLVSEGTNIKNTVKNVKEIFVKIGYEASFGVRQTNSDMVEETLENDISYSEENETEEMSLDFKESNDIAKEKFEKETVTESVVKKERNKKSPSKKSDKNLTVNEVEDTDYFDDEDENPQDLDAKIELDAMDMDMLLNEDSIQFSLEDFGMM